MDFTIVCRNCGWEWKENQTESFDRHVCHKCGFDNKFIGFLGATNNFRNLAQVIDVTNNSGDGLIYGGNAPSSGVIAYKFFDYNRAKNYSMMSCDALKEYAVELSKMNPEASGTGGMYATQFIKYFNYLRNAVDSMINSKCANVSIYNCGAGTWSISPSLPFGLSINTNTGAITGKSNQPWTSTYTITFTPIIGTPISTKWTLNILSFDLSSLQ